MSSRSGSLSVVVRGLVLMAAVGASQIASAGNWLGYMNVYFLTSGSQQGSFIFDSSWGIADLKTTISNSNAGTIIGDQLVLEPNYNCYTDSLVGSNGDRAFWTNSSDGGVTPGPLGNKFMNANTYSETASIAVPSATFNGNVTSNTLNTSLYTAKAFIKVLDPLAGFATVLNDSVTLPTSGTFSITSNLAAFQGKLLQMGFSMDGINGNPVDSVSNGAVAVTITPVPEPATWALGATGLLAMAGLLRRRARR